jgi:hypothetical protein
LACNILILAQLAQAPTIMAAGLAQQELLDLLCGAG